MEICVCFLKSINGNVIEAYHFGGGKIQAHIKIQREGPGVLPRKSFMTSRNVPPV